MGSGKKLLETLLLICLLPVSQAFAGEEYSWSFSFYGGKWSDNRIGQILYSRARLRSSATVWAAGIGRALHRISDGFAVETELNFARHRGRQDHFEINAAVLMRRQCLLWGRRLLASLAYGLGPSYAFRCPPIEQRTDRDPARLLVFMPVELAVGAARPGAPPWELIVRIHHRSGAYGVVSDAGGSNFVAVGMRRYF